MGKLELNKKRKKSALYNTAFELFTTKGLAKTTISLSPSEITFPLSMVTLEKLSEERIIPVTITNGE